MKQLMPPMWLGTLLVGLLGLGSMALAAPLAYITNQLSNDVSVLDTATNTVVATIPVGSAPRGVALHPAGTVVYVANHGSGTVSVLDTATNTVIATVTVGEGLFGVAVHPVGAFVYVTNRFSNTVSVIDTATHTVVDTVPVGFDPVGVAVHPAGTVVYVANLGPDTVSVLDTATNTVIATVPVGGGPFGVAVHPAGTVVYVTKHGDSAVSVIDAATHTVVDTVPVGSFPIGVAVHPAGTVVYVTNGNSDTVSVIDTATHTVVDTVPVGEAPYGVAVHSVGTFVYVANNGDGTVSVLDTATNTVIATVTVGDAPVAFGQFITPEPCPDCLIDAGLVVGTGEAGPGDTVTIPVEVRNAPNEVNALGFDVRFPLATLQFVGCDFSGTLLATWDDRNCAERPSGIVRVGGFTVFDAIPAGASGTLVNITFQVVACAEWQELPLPLENLVDDVAQLATCVGCFTCVICSNGDIDLDEQVTPGDALICFRRCFFEGECTQEERVRCDITKDGQVTPADALCIFRQFLGLPLTADCLCFLPR